MSVYMVKSISVDACTHGLTVMVLDQRRYGPSSIPAGSTLQILIRPISFAFFCKISKYKVRTECIQVYIVFEHCKFLVVNTIAIRRWCFFVEIFTVRCNFWISRLIG